MTNFQLYHKRVGHPRGRQIFFLEGVLWLSLLGLTLAGCAKNVDTPVAKTTKENQQTQLERRTDLPPGLYGVESIDFDSPNDDFLVLDNIIGDATVVGVGESRHGTLGFADAYLRVIRYLIEEKGFRAIATESTWINGLRYTNEYIHGADMSVDLAMVGLTYSTWRTPAMAGFLQWLREWNLRHPDAEVGFFGFDLQNGIIPGRFLRQWIEELVDDGVFTTAQQNAFIEAIANCPGAKYDGAEIFDDPEELAIIRFAAQLPESRYLECLEGMDQLALSGIIEYFAGDEQTMVRAAIRSLQQYNEQVFYWFNDLERSNNARDLGMADLFELFQNSPRFSGRKIAIIAHNVHTQRRTDELAGPGGILYPTYSMGTWIDDRIGADYVPIGFFARKMVFNFPHSQPVGNDPWTHVVTWPQSVEHIIYKELTGTGLENAIVNLYEATAINSLFQPGASYEYGLLGLRCTSVPIRHFDGLFFIENSPFHDY